MFDNPLIRTSCGVILSGMLVMYLCSWVILWSFTYGLLFLLGVASAATRSSRPKTTPSARERAGGIGHVGSGRQGNARARRVRVCRIWSPEEIERLVVIVRLEQYNRGLRCGAAALRRLLDEHYSVRPLPSVHTIGEILTRNCLTNGRTGWYEGEDQGRSPVTMRRARPTSQKGG